MPRRDLPKKQEDPFRRINNWDDGMGSHGKDYDERDRDRDGRSRRNRRQAYSSPSPSPVRRRRHSLDARATAPGGVPRSKDYFPQRHHDNDDYDRPRDSDRGHGRERDRDRHSDRDRDRDRYSSPSPRRHHRDRDSHHNRDRGLNSSYYDSHPANPHGRRDEGDIPPPKPPRPGLHRSKTTSAKERLVSLAKAGTNLSPRWQKAATAALQAGGMAALQARKQPGDWAGMKGAKVATAALGAMAMEGFARSAAEKSEKRDRSRDRDRDRDYRDRNRDRSRDRDRDYRDRDRDRDRDRGSGKGPSGKKNSDVEVLGDMLGGFIMDQWAKRGPNKARA